LTEAIESKLISMVTTGLGEMGEVVHLAKSGRIIVKLYGKGENVRSGEMLIDSSGKKVGKIVELIGPVSSPYASVTPATDRTSRLIGAKVFGAGLSQKIKKTPDRKETKRVKSFRFRASRQR
jgi:rRNA processing protein Gar1